MNTDLIARTSIIIDAPLATVWKALTTPEIIKQYFFGTEVVTDWKVGSAILWKGVWNDHPYEDKGILLDVQENKVLEMTYWSNMSGIPDAPENYKKVRYELAENIGQTTVTVTQDNNATPEEKEHSESNWHMALEAMKKLLESDTTS